MIDIKHQLFLLKIPALLVHFQIYSSFNWQDRLLIKRQDISMGTRLKKKEYQAVFPIKLQAATTLHIKAK